MLQYAPPTVDEDFLQPLITLDLNIESVEEEREKSISNYTRVFHN